MIVQPRLASAVMLLRDRPSPGRGQAQPVAYTEQLSPGQGQAQPVAYTERGIEVFMVRRVIESDFMPDVYVFPGGSVSADDRAAEQTEGVCTPVAQAAADHEG